jgi:hypothetical protein
MARYELWLAEQAKMIDDGAAVATIVLEDSDGSVAGTWPIGFRDLTQAIEGMLISLREALPKGRHQFRLAAFDQAKNQLSFLPVVVQGASDAATDASRGRVDQERANALFIGNCEKMLGVQQRLIDSMSETQSQLLEAHAKTSGQLEELIELTRDEHTKLIRESAQQERLGKMFEQFAPILQAGLAFGGEYAARWLAEKMSSKEPEPPKSPSQPPAPITTASQGELACAPQSEKGQLTSEERTPASSESVVSSPVGADGKPSVIRADGQGCSEGISGSRNATIGNQVAAINRKPKRRERR